MDERKPLSHGAQVAVPQVPGVRAPARPIVRGRAVQVDPIKHTLKAPGSVLLKLRIDGPVLNFAFNFNLRRYKVAQLEGAAATAGDSFLTRLFEGATQARTRSERIADAGAMAGEEITAGACTRPLLRST